MNIVIQNCNLAIISKLSDCIVLVFMKECFTCMCSVFFNHPYITVISYISNSLIYLQNSGLSAKLKLIFLQVNQEKGCKKVEIY